MNVYDLELLFSLNRHTLVNYRGTYAVDMVPSLQRAGFIVINTDRHDSPGQHWLLYMRNINGKFSFVDSFGLPPIERELQCLQIDEYNDKCIQSLYSVHCGLYVSVFASLLCKGASLKSIVSLFGDSLVSNDLLVIKMTLDEFIN